MESDMIHHCHLPFPQDDILKQTINTGIFIQARRRWYRCCMISKIHPRTPLHFSSAEARRKERIKQVVHNINTIHPFSLFALHWEFGLFIVYLYCFIFQAINSIYLFTNSVNAFRQITSVGDLILFADIIKTFWTGIYDKESSRTIFHYKTIAKRYFKFYLWVDLLSISRLVPVLLLNLSLSEKTMGLIIVITRFLGLTRILRLGRLLESLDLFRLKTNSTSFMFKLIKIILLYIIILCWLFTLTMMIETCLVTYFNDKVPSLADLLFSIIMLLEMVSRGYVSITETHHFIIIVVLSNIGFVVQLFLFAQIMQFLNKYANTMNKNENLYLGFKEYAKYKSLPIELRSKIFSFYKFRYEHEFFNEKKIESMFSRDLKENILMHVSHAQIKSVDLFEGIPRKLLIKLVSKFRTEIYLPDDVIVTAGAQGTCMYFIHFGTVAVFTPSGKELCHLEDGDHFGEIALVFTEKRVATVMAVTPCELFKLKKSDFFHIMKPFPKLKEKITQTARLRLISTRKEF